MQKRRRKYNATPDTVHNYLPQGTRLIVRHFHNGNSTHEHRSTPDPRQPETLRTHPYVTHAFLIQKSLRVHSDEEPRRTSSREILANGTAMCSPRDEPDRRLGWHIAVNRALKDFDSKTETLGAALFGFQDETVE